jgi:CheY-like chemotaxis protein
MRVLIVEDEFEIGESVKSILEDEGYEAFLVSDGKEAVELLKKIPAPQLILTDVMMPKMDGYQLLEILRNSESYKRIPVIFMSAGNPKELESRLKWNAFLKKPFNIDDLVNLVKRTTDNQGNSQRGIHA